MELSIRQEESTDHQIVFDLIKSAFQEEEISDHQEQFLVQRLRNSDAFIPELSLVAELNGQVVGHILLTKVLIKNDIQEFTSLALAPVSVLPNYQRKGIGGQLIQSAHQKAKSLGYTSIVLLGHENYYPRFGYQQAHLFGINFPFEAPRENCFVLELIPNTLQAVYGTIEYAQEFYQ